MTVVSVLPRAGAGDRTTGGTRVVVVEAVKSGHVERVTKTSLELRIEAIAVCINTSTL